MKFDLKSRFSNIKLLPQAGLTGREFMLIALLIIAVEGYLLFSYVLQPTYERYKSSLAELNEKQTLLTGLKIDFSRKEDMENEIEDLEKKIIDLQKQMPAYVSQEEVILFLEEMTSKTGLKIQSVGFTNAVENSNESASQQTAQQTAGAGNNGTIVVDASGAVTYKQDISINFVGDYQQVYDFMKNVEQNIRKVSIDSVSLQTSSIEDMSGVMSLSFISYWDSVTGQRPYEMVPAPIPGKASPFDEYSGYSTTAQQAVQKPKETTRPDFYLMINSYLNNSSKIFLMNYFDSGSEAIDDRNEAITAQLTLEGSGGTYTYSYKLGSYDIKGSRPLEVKEGKIRMDVVVQPRKSEQDKVGVLMDITNNSDIPFEITVKGDDNNNPRFIQGRTVGSVTVK
jgi:Tfp pilus assembly protein PilO